MTGSSADVMLTIDGQAVPGDAGEYPVLNPARPSEVVLHAPSSSPAQVDRAVRSAANAAAAWAALPFEECAQLVIAAGAAAFEAASGLAPSLTRENGKVLGESQFELATIGGMTEMFAAMAEVALAPGGGPGAARVEYEPFGVVAALLPFNWPVSVLISKLAPALLSGNVVVVKPPPTCPGTVLQVAQAFAAALPPGVVNTVNGPGVEVGEALVTHPDVAMVSLTGGPRTGRAVMAAAARHLTPVLLELGGNDAAIIGPDVEPNEALAGALLDAAWLTSGQVCMALKRLYVPERRLREFVDALTNRAATTVVGDGLAPETTHGPVHTAQAAAFAEELLAEAAAEGTRVHRPGSVREEDREAGGHFVAPAIVDNPGRQQRIVTEEQFAPVLPVLTYSGIDDAIEAANDSVYGLGASVWTDDDILADSVAERLQAGTVFRNAHGPGALDPNVSFGGWKQSGIGREFGTDGIIAYTRQRAVLPTRPLPGP
ncbi:MAG: aldehyde dehydrogenase [Actinomycetia bacterium]|nr:aldehyde dehydrogenase [Actinomycetes bacterium]